MTMVLTLSRIAGSLLIVMGGVFMLQGAGVLEGSAMTGSLTWLVIGTVLAVVGFVLLVPWRPRRRLPRRQR